jgi:hypothetical protein
VPTWSAACLDHPAPGIFGAYSGADIRCAAPRPRGSLGRPFAILDGQPDATSADFAGVLV